MDMATLCVVVLASEKGATPRLLMSKRPGAAKLAEIHSLPAQFLHSQKLPDYPQLNQFVVKVLSPAQDDGIWWEEKQLRSG